MKLILLALLAIVTLMAVAPPVAAQDSKAINLALWDPVQIFDRDVAIHGVRLNIYGRNAELKGLDLGIANWITGDVTGIQWGVILNVADGDFTGWQHAPIQKVGGFMKGIQTGVLFSMNGSGKGAQLAGVTMSDNFIGLQFGVVNYAVQLHGIQLGLINIIKEGGMLPFFPIFNFSFDK